VVMGGKIPCSFMGDEARIAPGLEKMPRDGRFSR
jgi:hypothetical protein